MMRKFIYIYISSLWLYKNRIEFCIIINHAIPLQAWWYFSPQDLNMNSTIQSPQRTQESCIWFWSLLVCGDSYMNAHVIYQLHLLPILITRWAFEPEESYFHSTMWWPAIVLLLFCDHLKHSLHRDCSLCNTNRLNVTQSLFLINTTTGASLCVMLMKQNMNKIYEIRGENKQGKKSC